MSKGVRRREGREERRLLEVERKILGLLRLDARRVGCAEGVSTARKTG